MQFCKDASSQTGNKSFSNDCSAQCGGVRALLLATRRFLSPSSSESGSSQQIGSKLTPAPDLFLLFFYCTNQLLTLPPSTGEGRQQKGLRSEREGFKCRPGPRWRRARCQMTWRFPCSALVGAVLSRLRGRQIAEVRGCAALTLTLTLPPACTSHPLFNNGRDSCFQMWTSPALTRMASSPVCATQNNIFIS